MELDFFVERKRCCRLHNSRGRSGTVMTRQRFSPLYPVVNPTENRVIALHQSIKSCSAVWHLCVPQVYMSDRKLQSRQPNSHQVDLNFSTNRSYVRRADSGSEKQIAPHIFLLQGLHNYNRQYAYWKCLISVSCLIMTSGIEEQIKAALWPLGIKLKFRCSKLSKASYFFQMNNIRTEMRELQCEIIYSTV